MAFEGEDRHGNPSILHSTLIQSRTACGECQRRKQKCNREWPCSHCQKRKVADKCRFATTGLPFDKAQVQTQIVRKRPLHVQTYIYPWNDEPEEDEDEDPYGFEAMGYISGPLLSNLNDLDFSEEAKGPRETVDWATPETCPQLEAAYKLLPRRENMDAIIQSFFETVNMHYYIIYPTQFLGQYRNWWERRAQGKPVTLQWTCLLIMICACTVQHLDDDTRIIFDISLGESTEILAEKYRQSAQALAGMIPIGHYHIQNIQRMLHSIYWYKAEAKFPEAWYLISAAIREAQELGFNQELVDSSLSNFEGEMRRRVWCILETWDWQFASGLGRPTIIDRTDVDIRLPNLSLELNQVSPCLYMSIQADVVHKLADRFGAPKNVDSVSDLKDYHDILEQWIDGFPPIFSMQRTDFSMDNDHPWLIVHRYYLHTMANLMLLNPIRSHMSQELSSKSPASQLEIRQRCVDYGLRNLSCTSQWVSHVSHKDGRFHFIVFSLFDTAALLCMTLIRDVDTSVPRRNEIVCAIDNAMSLLLHLRARSKTAKASQVLLTRIVRRVPYLYVVGDLPPAKKPRRNYVPEQAAYQPDVPGHGEYNAEAQGSFQAPVQSGNILASNKQGFEAEPDKPAQAAATTLKSSISPPDSGYETCSNVATDDNLPRPDDSPPKDLTVPPAMGVSPNNLQVPTGDSITSPSDSFSLTSSSMASPNNQIPEDVAAAPLTNFVDMEPYATTGCAPPWPVEELPYAYIPGQTLLDANGQPIPTVPFEDALSLETIMKPGELAGAFMAEFLAT